MEKLEKYVNKETFLKLSNVGITNWEELLKIHRREKTEFWNDFSKTISETQRIKLEKVLYRECCWDNDKYYYNTDGCIYDNGEIEPRQMKDDEPKFEIIRFEATIAPGNIHTSNVKNVFVEEKVIIDRLKRTYYRKIHYANEGPVETKISLDYYDLNKIFAFLRQDVNNENFGNGFVESTRYSAYKLIYADGSEKIYNIWNSLNQSMINKLLQDAIESKRKVMTSYVLSDVLELD